MNSEQMDRRKFLTTVGGAAAVSQFDSRYLQRPHRTPDRLRNTTTSIRSVICEHSIPPLWSWAPFLPPEWRRPRWVFPSKP